MTDELPPLPTMPADRRYLFNSHHGPVWRNDYREWNGSRHIASEGLYDADQMRAYAAAAVAREREKWEPLCVEIDAHMRREWDARRLPAECWPTDLAQRLAAAIRSGAQSPGLDRP